MCNIINNIIIIVTIYIIITKFHVKFYAMHLLFSYPNLKITDPFDVIKKWEMIFLVSQSQTNFHFFVLK